MGELSKLVRTVALGQLTDSPVISGRHHHHYHQHQHCHDCHHHHRHHQQQRDHHPHHPQASHFCVAEDALFLLSKASQYDLPKLATKCLDTVSDKEN
jgi:hypothetical protein